MSDTRLAETEVKEIIVIRGDEYRAKTSGSFSKKIFFSDVYVKANRLINEIIGATEAYSAIYEHNIEEAYKNQLRGVGNNIIIFTGWRGQGKTSAMQTFANYLRGRIVDEGEELFGNVGCYKKNRFEVLGTIDPTMMNRNESIVKVLLSRLFVAFDEKTKDNNRSRGSREYEEKKREVLRLFSQCYDNVNYFGNEEIADYRYNDLDSLARLGSSTELRCNLHKLISKYLDIDKAENAGRRFLVIQIDDADLSTANTYETCEQIREYLTIPNVIVLMATDFRQIRNSVYQAYIKEYEDVLNLQDRVDMVDNCFRKTMKYLEKMFPQGHRINLPELKDNERLNFDYLKLIYKDNEESAENKMYFPGCETIKDQVLRLIFERTGVIFRRDRFRTHPFFPETLRELTHLLRFLFDDMECVEQDDLYKDLFSEDLKQKSEVYGLLEKQNANLDQLFRYFWDNWAYERLGKKSFEVLRKIVSYNSDVERARVFIIEKYMLEIRGDDEEEKEVCKDDKEEEADKSKAITMILDYASKLDHCDGYGNLEAAISIFCTIRLNQWFNEDLRNRKLERFEGFENIPFEIVETGTYSFTEFELNYTEELKKRRVWRNLLAPIEGEDSSNKRSFSGWNLIASRVRAIGDADERSALGVTKEAFLNSQQEDETDFTKLQESVSGKADWSFMLNVKAIVTNTDVREFLEYWIRQYSTEWDNQIKDGLITAAWNETLEKMLNVFSDWRNLEDKDKSKPYAYLKTFETFRNKDQEIEECVEAAPAIFNTVFLGNDDNRKEFTKVYEDRVESYCERIKSRLEQEDEKSAEEVNVRQVAGDLMSMYNDTMFSLLNWNLSDAAGEELRKLYKKQKDIAEYIKDSSKNPTMSFRTFKIGLLRRIR